MTDTENEAVAKALETLRNEHADALDEWEAYPGRPMPAPLTSEDLARAAIRAIDAHRATVPDAVRELTEAIRLTPTPGSHEHHWTYDGSRQVCRGCGDQRDAFPTPEPTVKPTCDVIVPRGEGLDDCGLPAGPDGYCARHTPEPTVKPDTSIVVGQQMCKPDRAVVAMECYKFHAHDYSDLHSEAAMALALVEADLILALLPGKTEREVAEAAWDEAFKAGVDYMYCEREDYDGFGGAMPPPNPHRAKGATSD